MPCESGHTRPGACAALLLAAAFGLLCPGQPASAPAAAPQSAPSAATQPGADVYWLKTTASELNVRAKPDQNSTALVRLPRGAVVRGYGAEFGWHAIAPPESVFSLVSAEFVEERSGGDGVVTLRSGKLRVRAGSAVATVDPTRVEVQTLLENGAQVQIVGREDGWLRIKPPADVRVYVSAEFVERISPEEAARLGAASASQPSGERAAQPDADETAELSGRWGRELVAIEERIRAQAARPPLEPEWTPLMQDLEPIAEQREEPVVARIAAAWVERLRRRQQDQDALREADAIARREQRDREQFERERAQLERARQSATQPAFDARGVLLSSLALRGQRDAPRYKLEDPLTGRLVAYADFAEESKIDPEKYLRRYVGVRGARRHDAQLGADVVRVTHVELVQAPEPPKPPKPPATQPAGHP